MKLHVGLVAPLPPPYGGMANQANQLYGLLKLEKDLQVSFVQTNRPYANQLIGKIKGVRALFRLIAYIARIFKLARKVDVIHVLANSGWSWQLFAAPVIWIGWLCGTPVIINYRGGEARAYFLQSIKWVAPTMRKASVIVVPSGYLKQVFAEFNFKSLVIPNIIDLERFKADKSKVLNTKQPHLVITRNLEAIYGIATAIKALTILKKNHPKIKLSIAGSGPQKDELQSLMNDLQLEGNIHFTGKLPPSGVARLYQEADIMLNPTTVDNMPNSVLEAMASGVPIVTTNVGGIPYIVKDGQTALLIEPENAELMAEKIHSLLSNKELYAQLITNGLAEVQQYSWSHVRNKWLDLYFSTIKTSL